MQDWLAALLHLAAPLLAPAFERGAFIATWLEIVAFVLSIAMVRMNQRVHPASWPLAISASALYALLFASAGLYGEASLQLFFIAMAIWGWWSWLRHRGDDATRGVTAMPATERWIAALVTLAAWLLIGLLLARKTNSVVPWLDALPTAGSVVATWMLGRKRIENWPAWIAVNLVSIGLFAFKGLWLTVVLYAIFCALAWQGWRQWRVRLPATASPAPA